MRISDWSSDVCSSDLHAALQARSRKRPPVQARVDAASPNLDVGDDVAERGVDIILKALDRRVVQREVERQGPNRIQLHSDLKGERPLAFELRKGRICWKRLDRKSVW